MWGSHAIAFFGVSDGTLAVKKVSSGYSLACSSACSTGS
jgi:hypothetical protein